MRTLIDFYAEAKKAFAAAGLPGDFLGIAVEGENVFFVHNSSIPGKTLWKNAAGSWEGVYRSLRALNR